MKRKHLPTIIILIVSISILSISCSQSNKTAPKIENKSDISVDEKKPNTNIAEEKLNTSIAEEKNKKSATKIPVLLYHHLLTEEDIKKYNWSNNKIAFPVEAFEKQIKYLHDNNYHTATLDELDQFIDGKINLPENTVVLTFDDGFLSNAIYAYPIMKKYDLKGTIFVIGSAAEAPKESFDPKTVQYINKDDMEKYKDVFAFESHTYKLHKMNENKEPLLVTSDKKDVVEDLSKNKELLNAKYIAYPFGSYSEETIEYLKEIGHKMAFTVEQGYVTRDLNKYKLPRFEITPKTSMDQFINIVNPQ